MYGFKRSPFTYRHRIGYNYLQGFEYQGIFPGYDPRKSFYLEAFIGTPQYFSNFFGFGNDTDGFKDEKNNYNQVNIRKYSISPSFHLDIKKNQQLILYLILESYKVKYKESRYIAQVYDKDNDIFDMNFFADLGISYRFRQEIPSFLSRIETFIAGGWNVNLEDVKRNFPYTQASLTLEVDFTKKFSWVTKATGKVLYTDKYDFYHAASTELHGFRESRFIGKQAFYQFSDLRLDMGTLKNPIIPLKYGIFGGVDYGQVWYPGEDSHKWHSSYGGGLWLTLINKITTKYSWFGSTDSFRFMFELGLGF
ncbi:MAG: hypothetical protein LIO97_05910 [Tannerellaceae bacterium]|nr:hypothetical protein [Tannerellaceae bacterium]